MDNRFPVVRKDGQNVQIPAGDGLLLRGALNGAPVVDAPSASVLQLDSYASNVLRVTGANTITQFAGGAGSARRVLYFHVAGVQLRHAATGGPGDLVLPGSANIDVAPNDVAVFFMNAAGRWVCESYARGDGTALVSSGGGTGDFKKDGSVQMTGALVLAPYANVTLVSEPDIKGTPNNYARLTGTTPATVSRFSAGVNGDFRMVRFPADVTLVHNEGYTILPGAANIVTQANDTGLFFCEGGQTWRCLFYTRADGTALVSGGGSGPASTDALPEGATNLYFTGDRARSATRFTWDQSTAMAVWTVPHNTNGFPSVTVVDTLGNVVTPDISYVDANTVQITHGAAYAGKAYIN